ncbi:MAG: hypothetical protein LBK99_00235 [Opitutaceae bacterium]|jgi:hypothetical protein|nr:hypothetical protein [Opitutaceae bacterium]
MTIMFHRIVNRNLATCLMLTGLASGAQAEPVFHPADSNNDEIRYSTNICGWYRVTVPAGQLKLVARQLDATGTQAPVPLDSLFPVMPPATYITKWTPSGQFASVYGRNGWSLLFDINIGESVRIANSSNSNIEIIMYGQVVQNLSRTYTNQGSFGTASVFPIAATITDYSLAAAANDYVTETSTGSIVSHIFGRSGWSGGIPSFGIGEGFLYQRGDADTVWTQTLLVDPDTLQLGINL